jgi:hypothetical protein
MSIAELIPESPEILYWPGIAQGMGEACPTHHADEIFVLFAAPVRPLVGSNCAAFSGFLRDKRPFPRHRLVLVSPKRSFDLIKAEDCLIPGIWRG